MHSWKSSPELQASIQHRWNIDHLDPWRTKLCSSRTPVRHTSQAQKITMHPREETCIIYLFYYNNQSAEEEGPLPTAMQPSSTSDGTGPINAENVSKKRDGPESRSVILAPERKRQKIEFVRKDYEFIRNYYCQSMVNHLVQFDIQIDWHYGFDCMTQETRNMLHYHSAQRKKTLGHLFSIAYRTGRRQHRPSFVAADRHRGPERDPAVCGRESIQADPQTSDHRRHGPDRLQVGPKVGSVNLTNLLKINSRQVVATQERMETPPKHVRCVQGSPSLSS